MCHVSEQAADPIQLIDTMPLPVCVYTRSKADLGWLHTQVLLAEKIHDRTLRAQLLDWGWRPHSLSVSDQAVAALARLNLQQDPAQGGGGGLSPDPGRLLNVLAGYVDSEDENRLVFELTVEVDGLPTPAADLPHDTVCVGSFRTFFQPF